MRSHASYDITLSGTRKDLLQALFCLADIICNQDNILAELIDKYDLDEDFYEEECEDEEAIICAEDIAIWQTCDCVWIEDIQGLAIEMARVAPEIRFSISGHIEDLSDNAGDEMDFIFTYENKKLFSQSTDWYQYIHMDDFDSYTTFATKFCDCYGKPRYSKEDFEGFKQCADEWYVLDSGAGEFSTNAPMGERVRIKISKAKS